MQWLKSAGSTFSRRRLETAAPFGIRSHLTAEQAEGVLPEFLAKRTAAPLLEGDFPAAFPIVGAGRRRHYKVGTKAADSTVRGSSPCRWQRSNGVRPLCAQKRGDGLIADELAGWSARWQQTHVNSIFVSHIDRMSRLPDGFADSCSSRVGAAACPARSVMNLPSVCLNFRQPFNVWP